MRIPPTLSVFLIFLILTASCCKKNKNEEPELPPETQTGAMTFGCKVNGKVFVPKDGRGKPGLFVQYVNLGNGPGGGWNLNIPAVDQISQSRETIQLITDSLLVEEGQIYLFKNEKGYSNARYSNGLDLFVIENNIGELIITKHNQAQRILSGRFWFNAINASGQKVEIREGRFDIVY